jgi:hypothetical protein
LPLSNRDKNEKGPSNAPLPSFIVPLPSLSVPSHTADPVRVAIFLSPFVVMQAIVPAILADTIVCLTPLSADAAERNAVFALNEPAYLRLCEAPDASERRSSQRAPRQRHAASGAAMSPSAVSSSLFFWASARTRCFRASQRLSAHQPAVTGTAIQLMALRLS